MKINNPELLKREIDCFNSFEAFKENTGFLDIETTGLSSIYHDITIIGIYNKNKVNTYIKDYNMQEANNDIQNHNYIVTFNGNRFDIPFIKAKLNIEHKFKSIDLRYILRHLGYNGGLKKIEQELGIIRDSDLEGIDGLEAVRLWRRYKETNRNEYLDKLIRYNKEDIINLEVLLNFVYYKSKDFPVGESHIKFWKKDLLSKLENS